MRLLSYLFFIFMIACNKDMNENPSYTVRRGDISQKIALSGRSESSKQSIISAPFDISVKSLHISAGQFVPNDGVLAQLDTSSVLDKFLNEKTRLIQIETRIINGEIRVKNLQKELSRIERLELAGAASVVEKDQKKSELQISINDVQAIMREKENLIENLKIIEEQIKLLEIRSPFEGIVTYVWETQDKFVPGVSVKKGDVLFKLSSKGKMLIKTTCNENDVNYFTKGQKISVLFPNINNKKVFGEVVLVDHSATLDKDSNIAFFRIQIEFEPDDLIKPGMEAIIEHTIGEKKDAILIPKIALHHGDHGYEVSVIKDDVIIKKKVSVGLMSDHDVEILGGVQIGEEILVDHE